MLFAPIFLQHQPQNVLLFRRRLPAGLIPLRTSSLRQGRGTIAQRVGQEPLGCGHFSIRVHKGCPFCRFLSSFITIFSHGVIAFFVQFLAIGNGGLACGYSEEDLRIELPPPSEGKHADHVVDYDIFLLVDEPFALVKYCCKMHAEGAFSGLISKVVAMKNGQSLPWYPAYLETRKLIFIVWLIDLFDW